MEINTTGLLILILVVFLFGVMCGKGGIGQNGTQDS